MPSLVPGYEYDIFISYRQKDNKHDGWVTEFVDNLKGELESTFKEDVSVYFDINPHDGLLETHDVNASLKEKLKCLVFIPIISQTYCDSKSFAWQNEFVAFNNMAKEDQFGRDIKLSGGNVASRILPVKIHDLDSEDKSLLENELGGFIRGIEFIYKEPGVNRPLKPEDDGKKNLNNAIYRNQINKVANAIKEIITGLRKHNQQDGEVPKEAAKVSTEHRKKLLPKIIIAFAIILVLALLGYFFIPRILESSKPVERSIAVLPFHNFSSEPDQENMSDGLTSEIINHLYKIKSLDKVVPLGSVLTYKGTNKNPTQIANELKVNYILEGTYKKIGDEIIVTAQLIDPKSDKILWQHPYKEKNIISVQADIALKVAGQLKAFLTSQERQNIQKIPTNSKEAYELLQKAGKLWAEGGITRIDEMLDLYNKAIGLDPEYSDAFAWAGITSIIKGLTKPKNELNQQSYNKGAESYLGKAIETDQYNGMAHFGIAILNEWINHDYITAEKEYLDAIELEPNNPDFANFYFEFLIKMSRYENTFLYQKKIRKTIIYDPEDDIVKLLILTGNRKEANDSINVYLKTCKDISFAYVGDDYIWLEKYDSAKFYLESAIKLKDVWMLTNRFQAYLAFAFFKTNQINQAQKIINQMISDANTYNTGFPDYYIGWYYSGIGKVDSAFYWFEKAYKNGSPEFQWFKVDPAFNHIKKDPRYWGLYERTGHKAYDDYMKTKKN
jgi:TolB-like protein